MDDFKELDAVLDEHFGRSLPGDQPHGTVATCSGGDQDGVCVDDVWPEEEREYSLQERIDSILIDEHTDGADGSDDSNTEIENVYDFTCHCPVNCLSQFITEQINTHVLNIREMLKDEKEMYIMGVLQEIGIDQHKTWRGERKRKRYGYVFNGKRVCRPAFQYIYDIGRCALTNLQTHMNVNGRVPRIHGNTGRSPHHALKYDEVKCCTEFLVGYSEECGLPQPAAPRGRDGVAPVYLPAPLTKDRLHKEYKAACKDRNIRSLGLSSFKDVWSRCLPHIKIASARDDVCAKCELIRKRIIDAVSEEEKLETSTELQDHIMKAKKERDLYKQTLDDSKASTPTDVVRPVPPSSQDLHKVHYTFDFSQLVTLPHHYRQMGPLYFLSLRRVQIFGVRLDGIPLQYNYLTDEDQSIGTAGTQTHGPNAVISMLHHALTFYGYGEKGALMHCDNCGGQNKNMYMLAYLSWRTLVGLHENITLLMQVPGHTRCLVDGGFAQIKRLYRRSDVECLSQLVEVVNKSASTNVAVPFLRENDEPTWEWSDWKSFLSARFVPLKGIQKYLHFEFKAEHPGYVFVKTDVDGTQERKLIMRQGVGINVGDRPCTLTPAGLGRDRQTYLYRSVRRYVRPEYQDNISPAPQEE